MVLAATAVVVIVVLVAGRPRGLPAWAVTVTGALTMAAAATFGAAVGTVASRLVAVPVAVAAAYGALAPAVADPSSWPGRVTVTGAVTPCCLATQQVSLPGLAVVGAVTVLVIGGGLFTVAVPAARPVRATILLGALTVAVASAWLAAQQVGPNGQLTARVTAPVCHETTGTQVCVWPEHDQDLPRAAQTIAVGRHAAGALGIDLPTRWSEAPTDGTVVFNWSSGLTATEHRYALAVDIAIWAGCTDHDDERLVASALALQMDVPSVEVRARDLRFGEFVDTFSRLPEAARRQQVLERVGRCRS